MREIDLCIDGEGLSIRAGPLTHHVPACRYIDASPYLCMRAIGFNTSATMTCTRVSCTLWQAKGLVHGLDSDAFQWPGVMLAALLICR